MTHVCPKEFAPHAEITGKTMQVGTLKAANGVALKRYGQKSVVFEAPKHGVNKGALIQGQACFQLLDVKRAIFSVSELCEKGGRVILAPDGGYIERIDSGKRIRFEKKGKLDMLNAKLKDIMHGGEICGADDDESEAEQNDDETRMEDSQGAAIALEETEALKEDGENVMTKPKATETPTLPSQDVIDAHNLLHPDFQAWRKHGVDGRAQDNPHLTHTLR